MAASAAVLNTYELLEHILLHLPHPDLLLAERVCRAWQDLIAKSTPISRALFRKTNDQDLVGKRVYSTNDAPANVEWTDTATGAPSPPPVLNPFMNPLLRKDGDYQKLSPALISRAVVGSPKVAFHRRDASWRRMLPRQPAQSNYTISCMISGAGVNVVRANGEPITMQDLSDGLNKHVSNCHKCDGHKDFYHVTGLASATRKVDRTITGWEVLELTGL